MADDLHQPSRCKTPPEIHAYRKLHTESVRPPESTELPQQKAITDAELEISELMDGL